MEWFLHSPTHRQYKDAKKLVFKHHGEVLLAVNKVKELIHFGVHRTISSAPKDVLVGGFLCPYMQYVCIVARTDERIDEVRRYLNESMAHVWLHRHVERYDELCTGGFVVFNVACASNGAAVVLRERFAVKAAKNVIRSDTW